MAETQLCGLQEVHSLQMSSTPSLQCLFCKHLNPAGASFCNDCGSQLNLQPCDRCGAIDNRAAKNCYKCGAEFTLPAAPGLNSLPVPTIFGDGVTYPALNDTAIADPQSTQPNHDLTHLPPEPRPVAETVSSEMGATATGSKQKWLVTLAVLLFALIAVSVYFHDGQSAQFAQTQGVRQAVPGASDAPMPAVSAPSTVAAPVDSALTPTDTMPKPAPSTVGLDKAPSTAPPGAGKIGRAHV